MEFEITPKTSVVQSSTRKYRSKWDSLVTALFEAHFKDSGVTVTIDKNTDPAFPGLDSHLHIRAKEFAHVRLHRQKISDTKCYLTIETEFKSKEKEEAARDLWLNHKERATGKG